MKQTQLTITGRVISKKNSKRMFKNRATGKMFPVSSKAYKSFRKDALSQLFLIRDKYKTPVHIDYLFCRKGKLKIDVDNAMASINDILEDSEIIEDDNLIVSTYAKKEQGYLEHKTYIRIIEL